MEDAIDIRSIKNIKLANQLLKLKRKQKQDRDEKNAQVQQQLQSQTQMQITQMQSQASQEKIGLETQSKIQEIQTQAQVDMAKMQAEADLKKQLMEQEFQYQMQLRGIQEEALNTRESSREDAKAKRISQQNTEQSQLINQRKKGLPPVNFESNEDTLDGFDLAEFEPR